MSDPARNERNCRALTSKTSMPQDSSSSVGNPIHVGATHAADSTPCSSNQSASCCNCGMVVPKVRTFGFPGPSGAHTQCSRLLRSIPATWGWIRDKAAEPLRCAFVLTFLLFCMRLTGAMAPARVGVVVRILVLRRASVEASLMNDGLLGPRLALGHGAPMSKRGLAAGTSPGAYSVTMIRCFSSYDPPRRGGRGPYLSETKPVSLSNDPHRRGGRGPYLSETNRGGYQRRAIKEIHEGARRTTKGH